MSGSSGSCERVSLCAAKSGYNNKESIGIFEISNCRNIEGNDAARRKPKFIIVRTAVRF